MLSHTNTVSLAGTWGDKKVNELQRGNSNNNTNSAFYNTTYSTNFTEKDMKSDVTPELLPSKSIAKFVSVNTQQLMN